MLDGGQVLICVALTISLVGAFVLGRNIGIEQERDRARRVRRNIEKARKAT
ncbi:MAG TPA: hypothetical protein VFP34_00195 [Microlunatus sp.]|nr:hypothetical protein [Microlunatus sp.]